MREFERKMAAATQTQRFQEAAYYDDDPVEPWWGDEGSLIDPGAGEPG